MRISSSEEESDTEINVSKKVQSETKLPKIKLLQRISTGDPDISLKPLETTLFNSSTGFGNTTKMNESVKVKDQTIHEEEEEEEMDIDQTIISTVSPKNRKSLTASGQKVARKDSKTDASESEIELPVATEAQLIAVNSSLFNMVKKNRNTLTPQKLASPSQKNVESAKKRNETETPLNDTESADSSESEDEATTNKSVNKSLNKSNGKANAQDTSSDSSDDNNMEIEIDKTPEKESENAKRKRRRRTAGLDETSTEEKAVKKTKLNASLVAEKKLDTILEKCNEILLSKKEEKKKNKLLHKKEKVRDFFLFSARHFIRYEFDISVIQVEKKQRKEILKQNTMEEEGQENSPEANDEALKKKKKKQKIGRKYNQEISGKKGFDKKYLQSNF